MAAAFPRSVAGATGRLGTIWPSAFGPRRRARCAAYLAVGRGARLTSPSGEVRGLPRRRARCAAYLAVGRGAQLTPPSNTAI